MNDNSNDMVIVKSKEDINKLTNGNRIKGEAPIFKNSEIRFSGNNNLFYCEPHVILQGVTLDFRGHNSVIYLSSNIYEYKLNVSIYNDSIVFMGKDNYINPKMSVILSEQKHCFIGNNGMFSGGICIRNADPHLIYDCKTKIRKNPSRSVFVGDHVWIGQECLILKGTQIDSGSIIGGKSVIAGKHIPHNTSWGENPARQISQDIFWDKAVVHTWEQEMTDLSNLYDDFAMMYRKDMDINEWIYEYKENEEVLFDDIEKEIDKVDDSLRKCEYLINLTNSKTKNRFVHSI